MGSYEDIPGRILGPTGGFRRPAAHALVRVLGPDAADYLHRLCSQDVLAMAPGDVRPACFLDAKGKLLQVVLLARLQDGLVVEAQGHKADALAELLDRFHFTEQLTLSRDEGLACAELWQVEPSGDPVPGRWAALAEGGIALCWQRHGVTCTRYHASAAVLDQQPWSVDARELSEQEHECLRIWAGLPLVGQDTDDRTLALEAPLRDHICTDKGCYTGQEVIARIHTYGHTNRALCLLAIDGLGGIEPGTSLCELDDGDVVGRVMSVVDVGGREARLGLGFLPAAFTAAGTKLALGQSGGAAVTVLPAPN
ncbi:MAG: CAF17-like 4Fe-4S cluster assembly/insertion protein YgfZ [Planctomycetota bacterium]|jgi:folate-binding protein YgfZ